MLVIPPAGDLQYATFVDGESQRSVFTARPDGRGGIWNLTSREWRSADPGFAACASAQPALAHVRPDAARYDCVVCVGGRHALSLSGKVTQIAGDGPVWITGQAGPDSGLTTVSAWRPAASRSSYLFIIRYPADGPATLVATYLGGSDSEFPTGACGARAGAAGSVNVVGETWSFASVPVEGGRCFPQPELPF